MARTRKKKESVEEPVAAVEPADASESLPKSETVPVAKDAIPVEVVEVKSAPLSTPLAVVNSSVSRWKTTVADKSVKKFLGGRWWNLVAGKEFTAPEEVILALRNGGFVK